MQGLENPNILSDRELVKHNRERDNYYNQETLKDQLCPIGLHSDVLNSLCSGHGLWICANRKRKECKNFNINYTPIDRFPTYYEYFKNRYYNDSNIVNGKEVYEYVLQQSRKESVETYDKLIENLNFTCQFFNMQFAFFDNQHSELRDLYDKEKFINKYIKSINNKNDLNEHFFQYLLKEDEYKFCLEANYRTYLKTFEERQKYLFQILVIINDLFRAKNLPEFSDYLSQKNPFISIPEGKEIYIN